MTHNQRATFPRPETIQALKIFALLPGAFRELPLPNGTIADLAAPLWIAEIEPARRWQTGMTQVLEYWDQTLRSARPILLLIDDGTCHDARYAHRIERVAYSAGIHVWHWNPASAAFTVGGPHCLPHAPDYSPLHTWTGQPWVPHGPTLTSCKTAREPFATWHRIYTQRNHERPPNPRRDPNHANQTHLRIA